MVFGFAFSSWLAQPPLHLRRGHGSSRLLVPCSPYEKWYLKNIGRGSLRASSSEEEFMETQKPTLWEIKRVQRALEFDEEDLTDREIWIAREFLDE